jgi:hypothetical protein
MVRHNAAVRSVLLLLLLSSVACGSTAEPAAVPDEVTGLITSIQRNDRGTIESLTVEQGGQDYEILIDPGVDYGFDLEHLEEHRAQRLPVRVTVERRSGRAYATQILDA